MKNISELFAVIRTACSPLAEGLDAKFSFAPTADKKTINIFMMHEKNFFCVLSTALVQNPNDFPLRASCPNDALVAPVEVNNAEELNKFVTDVVKNSLYLASIRKFCALSK